MNETTAWERIPGKGTLVYWRRSLGKNHYLTVVKAANRYRWAERGPDSDAERHFRIVQDGYAGTVQAAKRAADAALAAGVAESEAP